MTIINWVLTYVITLSVLVTVHEWGHFIMARLFKMRVDEFSLGFGPLALSLGKRGDTEYNIRYIPLGGYVKIAGMESDEEPLLRARDKARAALEGARPESESVESTVSKLPLTAENMQDVNETAEQRAKDMIDGFYTKPLWQRSLTIFAGPFMSFAFGYIIFCMMGFCVGLPGTKSANIVDSVLPGSVAQTAGLQSGDKIVQIDSTPISNGLQMVTIIHASAHKRLSLTIERSGETRILYGTPQVRDIGGVKEAVLGFSPRPVYEHEGFVTSIRNGNLLIGDYFKALGGLVARHKLSEMRGAIGGPVAIGQAYYQAAQSGLPDKLALGAQLSLSLAIFNLLPIPILDGGHLLLFAVEGLRRGRRLTLQQQQNFMLAGLAIIGVLFVLIMFNDITRLPIFHHSAQ